MKRDEILQEAITCVMKDRNATHGEPEDNFKNIASLWDAWAHMRPAGDITPLDVFVMMVLMKLSRLATSPTVADHRIDIAGYAACGGGIATEEADATA